MRTWRVFAETVTNNICIGNFLFRFANPDHWLKYFPPVAKADLKSLGVKVTGISVHTYMIAILFVCSYMYDQTCHAYICTMTRKQL